MSRLLARVAPLLGFLCVFPAVSAPASETSPQARDLIQRQLDAFAHGDAGGAYALATPSLRAAFINQGRFMQIVRAKYAPFLHHRAAEFGKFARAGGRAAQSVTLVGDDSGVWRAVYELTRQPNGSWLISNCLLVKVNAVDV